MRVEERADSLGLDAATRRNLELDSSLSGNDAATLFAVIDCSVTAMGSRALRRWLNRPIRAQPLLRQRYHAIATLADSRGYEALRARLRDIGDLERILARVALRSARAVMVEVHFAALTRRGLTKEPARIVALLRG